MFIFLDFDDVIFNTKKFRKDYFNLFKKRGISSDLFEKCYYDPLDKRIIKTYSPLGHIKRVFGNGGIDRKQFYLEVNNFIKDTSSYVFADVILFLNNFSKNNLCIVSFSKTNFQKTKIFNSGVAGYFGKIKITNNSKGEEIHKILKNKSSEINFFIDDRVEHIKDVKKKNPQIVTILLLRKEGRYADKKDKYCDYQAENFKKVLLIINNNIPNGKKTKN